ncbi:LysR family transcriptional regulator [Leisingera caerulea]|uniref:LysR family transcriptional regulator n=1 Tax=Leisingera caerulea TaxID=506591 RepID=UPI0021A55923|nr:LysR family transcriptional regulator [Leisingera caerulea]UWQ61971.1 LysR family transcriptional regulator [Leisingera caerulea]
MRHSSNLNLGWLSAFDAAARHLNFTKAAQELGLSQGAVSLQIQKLEKALSASLFERRGRHVVLTDEGYAYHPHVQEALEALSQTTSRMFSRQTRNNVSIACYSPAFVEFCLTPLIPDMMRDIPELELTLTIDYQANHTRFDKDDLVIGYGSGDAASFVPLVQETVTAVCTPAYLEQHGGKWGQCVLIECAGPRVAWPQWCAATGIAGPLDGRVVEVNSLAAAIRLARAGAGVSLAAKPFILEDLQKGALVEAFSGKCLPGKMHGFAAQQLENARPIAKRVARWLLERSGRSIPSYL